MHYFEIMKIKNFLGRGIAPQATPHPLRAFGASTPHCFLTNRTLFCRLNITVTQGSSRKKPQPNRPPEPKPISPD